MSSDFDDNQELCADFVNESREMLGEVEPILVELESRVAQSGELDVAQIDSIFRAFHSMKGSGGFLNLDNLVSVTHTAESLLDLFRKGQAPLSSAHITTLCRAMDFIGGLLDHIEAEFSDRGFEEESAAIVGELRQHLEAGAAAPSPPAAAQTEPQPESACEADADVSPEMLEIFIAEAAERLDAAEAALLSLERDPEDRESTDIAFRALHSLKGNCGFFGYGDMEELTHQAESLLEDVRGAARKPEAKEISALLCAIDVLRTAALELPAGGGQLPGPDRSLQLDDSAPGAAGAIEPVGLRPAPAEVAASEPAEAAALAKTRSTTAPAARASKGNIRVDLEKLDALMDLVGELILAETMVTHNPDLEGHDFERFDKAALQLNRITRSLQDVAMGARMIPIGGTFRKMLRLVRDLAQKQQKTIDLALTGEDTEIDKTVIEAIADPLVHIIRNSADHGIEDAATREQCGKPATGTIRLGARHQGGEIWITIEDDGRGLDKDAILAKAQARGLVSPARAGEMRDGEIYRLIFEAGLSTAKQVTDVSGRGVGMDVVRRNIENLNGRVDIASQLGVGTAITIRLPLTLAIVEGMLVRVGDSIYTLPLLSIAESVPIRQDDVTLLTGNQEMASVRDRLLPLIRLDAYHQIRSSSERLEDGIAIVIADDDPFCLWVDEIIGQRQTVIKRLPEYLGSVRGVSGCSILSNGDISLILDIQDIDRSGHCAAQ